MTRMLKKKSIRALSVALMSMDVCQVIEELTQGIASKRQE